MSVADKAYFKLTKNEQRKYIRRFSSKLPKLRCERRPLINWQTSFFIIGFVLSIADYFFLILLQMQQFQ